MVEHLALAGELCYFERVDINLGFIRANTETIPFTVHLSYALRSDPLVLWDLVLPPIDAAIEVRKGDRVRKGDIHQFAFSIPQLHSSLVPSDGEMAEWLSSLLIREAGMMPRISRFNGIAIYMYYHDGDLQMILRITELQVVRPHVLKLVFNDGTRKTVNVYPLLSGPVFEPLKDPEFFARVVLDPVAGTVVWPNDADLAPEALHDLRAAEETTAA